METYLEFGFLVSFIALVIMVNATAICFIRGSARWKQMLQWSLIPIGLVCLCIIAYP